MGGLGLGLRLGLFQLSLGILGVLILGLLNRLLIQDIQLPAVLAALAVGGQQLMGFTRAWFGHRSDRIPPSRLRRTPFIVISSLAIALLFGVACQLVLRLATSMEASGGELNGLLIGLLILVFVAIAKELITMKGVRRSRLGGMRSERWPNQARVNPINC